MPKKEIIDRMVSLGLEDFWKNDYEHSYRKFVNALYYDKNNISALSSRQEKFWNKIANADFLSDDEKKKILDL